MRYRVLHVVETVGSGGVEHRRLSLARLLDPSKYEQRLVCTQAFGALPLRLEEAGCPVSTVGRLQRIFDPAPYAGVLRVVRQFEPHIIHGAVYEGVAMAALVGQRHRVPVIIGEETSVSPDRRWSGHLLFGTLAHSCDHMVAVSRPAHAYLTGYLRVPRHRVSLIHNGVQEVMDVPTERRIQLSRSIGLPESSVVVGAVGRLWDEVKRFSDFLRGVAILRKEGLRLHALIVGDGPDRGSLESLSRQLGIEESVSFCGYREDARDLYSLMDVCVLPSAQESFGLVLVEAMQAGVPVIGTSVGGIPDIIEDGKSGILVPPHRPDILASGLRRLVQDGHLRVRLGEEGRQRARNQFGAERYVSDVELMYAKLLANAQTERRWIRRTVA
jgi:L-malate glycosyltransferase